MRKLSQINEGFLSKTLNRAKTGDVRKEQGVIVKTPDGDVLLDYNKEYGRPYKLHNNDYYKIYNIDGSDEYIFGYKNDDDVYSYFIYEVEEKSGNISLKLIAKSDFDMNETDFIYITSMYRTEVVDLTSYEEMLFKKRYNFVDCEFWGYSYLIFDNDETLEKYSHYVEGYYKKWEFTDDDIYLQIMKKLSQINEGFLSKTINRARTGEDRKEDKIKSNIEQLEPVDLGLPFLIADKDFELDEEVENQNKKFKWSEVEQLKPMFNKHGWRLPTLKELQKYINQSFLDYEEVPTKQGAKITIRNIDTHEKLYINPETWFAHLYWCEFEMVWKINIGRNRINSIFETTPKMYTFNNIRLVKDK